MQEQLGKIIIVAGITLVVIGLFFVFGKSLPLGKLPGDITVQKGNFTFFFPIMTSIVISVVLTLILFLIGRR